MAAEAVMKAKASMQPTGFFSTSQILFIGVQALNCACEVSVYIPSKSDRHTYDKCSNAEC